MKNIFKKKYPGLSFWENFLGEHLSIGRLTIYGENAMHWGVTLWTKKWGYICFRLPFRCFGGWWPLYFYLSPNATPWAATLVAGPRFSRSDKLEAEKRRLSFGHNYDTASNMTELRKINGWMEEVN